MSDCRYGISPVNYPDPVDFYDPITPAQIPHGFGGVDIYWKKTSEHLITDIDIGKWMYKVYQNEIWNWSTIVMIKSNSWFMDVQKILWKYQMNEIEFYLDKPIPKVQWKSLVSECYYSQRRKKKILLIITHAESET